MSYTDHDQFGFCIAQTLFFSADGSHPLSKRAHFFWYSASFLFHVVFLKVVFCLPMFLSSLNNTAPTGCKIDNFPPSGGPFSNCANFPGDFPYYCVQGDSGNQMLECRNTPSACQVGPASLNACRNFPSSLCNLDGTEDCCKVQNGEEAAAYQCIEAGSKCPPDEPSKSPTDAPSKVS